MWLSLQNGPRDIQCRSLQNINRVVALRAGEYFPPLSWTGLAVAVVGLVYLVSAGLTAPDTLGAVLMAIAGILGFYWLVGRSAAEPLEATAKNFIYCVPFVLMVNLHFLEILELDPGGDRPRDCFGRSHLRDRLCRIGYCCASRSDRHASATVQLSVPVIAALGGVILLSEDVTPRLLLASVATLGGVAIVLAQRAVKAQKI